MGKKEEPLRTNEQADHIDTLTENQLKEYATRRHDFIVKLENQYKYLTAEYWHLGKALLRLKKDFGIKPHDVEGLDRNTVTKSIAIAATFAKVEDCAEMAINDAYDKRDRVRESPNPKPKPVKRKEKEEEPEDEGIVASIRNDGKPIKPEDVIPESKDFAIKFPRARKPITKRVLVTLRGDPKELKTILQELDGSDLVYSIEDAN